MLRSFRTFGQPLGTLEAGPGRPGLAGPNPPGERCNLAFASPLNAANPDPPMGGKTGMHKPMAEDQSAQLWRRTRLLAVLLVGAVLAAAIILPFAIRPFNTISILGFPLGIFLLAQGLVIMLVVAAFWFASYQERIDRRHGAMEDL